MSTRLVVRIGMGTDDDTGCVRFGGSAEADGSLTVFSTQTDTSSGSQSAPIVVSAGTYDAVLTCHVTGPTPFPAPVVCAATVVRDDDSVTEITANDDGAGTTTDGSASGSGTITGGTTYTVNVGVSWSGPPNDETVWSVDWFLTLT